VTATTPHVQFAIAGSGFGGLGTAIRLHQAGEREFVILERADEVGGVWRDNAYPGCACDVQSHLYSFSFAPNPGWGRMFSRQGEIHAYLRDCVRDFELEPHLRLGHEVQDARWNHDLRRWEIETSRGPLTADAFVLATGALSEPVIPDVPGLGDFDGPVFHSARWDHGADLRGKRVAVIGTGASAIQFVPEIQPVVEQLTLFQRTPPWVMPRHDRALKDWERRLYKAVPLAQRLARWKIYAERELFVVGFRHPRIMRLAERAARRHLAEQVPDADLRRKLTPDFTLGCKRILISNDYLRSLAEPNADVVTSGVTEVRARSVVDGDGTEHPVDAVILGTGFKALDWPVAARIRGREGHTLEQEWGPSPKGHMGTTVAGFPNLFVIHGPNIGLGHTSVIHMFESQIDHILAALSHVRSRGAAALEPTRAAQQRFTARVEDLMEGTVWTEGGCTSWYLDRTGRNSSLWPGSTFGYRRLARSFRPEDHVIHERAAA
jgi:cation diffusion facilitator CzcD-associated flavoprotein CzcO